MEKTRFDFQKLLGSGAFADVFLCFDRKNLAQVAVKRLNTAKSKMKSKLLEFTVSEIEALNSIRNENVVRMLDSFMCKDQFHLVFEYCEGGTLEQYLQRQPNKRFSERETLDFLKQILNGFKSLHEMNLIHRDLKLDNILIKDGVLKISDFGFCKKADLTQTFAGTLYFMAPEIINFTKYDNKVDIWSLGVCLYRLLYGKLPFVAKDRHALIQCIMKEDVDFDQDGIVISKHMRSLLEGMLQKNPAERIGWKEIYGHALLNEDNQIKNPKIESSFLIMSKKQIQEESTKSQFLENKSIYSSGSSVLSKIKEKNPIEIPEINEFHLKENKDDSEERAILAQKNKLFELWEKRYLRKRNIISFHAKILYDGLKFGQYENSKILYFLMFKKISRMCENFAQKLMQNREEENQIFEDFRRTDFFQNLTSLFFQNYEVYKLYLEQYYFEANETKDDEIYQRVYKDLNRNFEDVTHLEFSLNAALCAYLAPFIAAGESQKDVLIYLNQLTDCTKAKEIFPLELNSDEGIDIAKYEKVYSEMDAVTLFEKLDSKYAWFCALQENTEWID